VAETDSTLQASLRSVAFHRVHAEKGEGIELAKQFQVTAYPTFILLNARAETITRFMGFPGPARFGTIVKSARADPTPLALRETRFAKKPTEKDAAALADAYSGQGDLKRAVTTYQRAQQLAGAGSGARYAFPIFQSQMQGLNPQGGAPALFTPDELTPAADQVIANPAATQEELMIVAYTMTNIALQQGQPDKLTPYVKAALKASEGRVDPQFADLRREFTVLDALYIQKDQAKALALKKATLPSGWEADPEQLVGFAGWCLQYDLNLEEAERLAAKAAPQAPAGKAKATALNTLGQIQFKRGHVADAVKSIEGALAEMPGNPYLTKQLTQFKAALPNGGH
jgi:tetratricopeptide (TPR) repeat protein